VSGVCIGIRDVTKAKERIKKEHVEKSLPLRTFEAEKETE